MIHVKDLDQLGTFYIETSVNDKFMIQKTDIGYHFKDLVPPVTEKEIADFKSIKMPKQVEQAVKNGTHDGDLSEVVFFDGIAKGFQFAFYTEVDMMDITKGKIQTLYFNRDLGNLHFRVHLLEQPGRKIPLDELKDDFVIYTKSDGYEFIHRNENLYFEDREVVALYSLFKFKGKSIDIDFSVVNEMDVTPNFIHLQKPMVILTKDDDNQIRFSFVYESVTDVRES
ncbi:hypothetical protein J2S74_003036 [Evansella vedderi]|uniref:Uncharacterized protein n=1 Tax=Evansella vedderi TaxID=38282 RepID=A0ABT9ZXT2_9BACI|nr:hypothetical protein [Evansella vedderi]MDQ0255654.1 hypothetical protein [Evansella vedderi]